MPQFYHRAPRWTNETIYAIIFTGECTEEGVIYIKIKLLGDEFSPGEKVVGIFVDARVQAYNEFIKLFEAQKFDGSLFIPVLKDADKEASRENKDKWTEEGFKSCDTIIIWMNTPGAESDFADYCGKLTSTYTDKVLFGRPEPPTRFVGSYCRGYQEARAKIKKSTLIQVLPSGLVAAALRTFD